MKNQWKVSDTPLASYNCLKHTVTKELTLYGKYGEIFQSGETTFKAVIFSARIAKRFLPKEMHPQRKFDEIVVSFQLEDLPLWVDRLNIPAKATTQLGLIQKRTVNSIAEKTSIEGGAYELA